MWEGTCGPRTCAVSHVLAWLAHNGLVLSIEGTMTDVGIPLELNLNLNLSSAQPHKVVYGYLQMTHYYSLETIENETPSRPKSIEHSASPGQHRKGPRSDLGY